MKLLSNILISLLLSFAFLLLTTQSAYAVKIDLLDYFLSTLNQGNPITTGEFFKVINHGDGTFTVQKSTDPAYYEKFRYDGNYIYHIEDTTWATDSGDVTCSESGNTAKLAYASRDQGIRWIAREMEVGECTDSAGEIIGVDEVTGSQCTTAHNGSFNRRRMCLTYQGCIKFPNGTASADAIALTIEQGPGAGEQFFYDNDRGWIGFNRGEDSGDSGAYITEDLSGGASLSGCLVVKVPAARCPRGYTCPDTSNKVVFGETINYEKKVFGGYSGLSGATGPTQNKLHFPNFFEEAKLFMDSEIIARSVPFELLEKHLPNFAFPEFTFPNLQGVLAHSGCEKVAVDGEDAGEARIRNDELKRFPTTPDYNKLLLGFRFWESQYVEGKSANLKYNAAQPGNPTVPEHRPGCNDKDGQSYQEATTVDNPLPPKNSLLNDLGGFIGKTLCDLGDVVGLQVCATVSVKVQQEKYLPGEVAFSDQSHNFLGSFIPFEEKGQPIDQEEQNSYEVFSTGRVEGVNYLGAKSTQDKTLELVKSLQPYEEARLITTLGPTSELSTPQAPFAGLPYTIPHYDETVSVSEDIKKKVVDEVLTWKKDSRIAIDWQKVYDKAVGAGINPAFAIAIWIEESAASSPTINPFTKGPADSDFGCHQTGDEFDKFPFDESLNCFVHFTANEHPNDFGEWAKYFCGPQQETICKKQTNFFTNLRHWYNRLVPPGSHGSLQPL